MQRGDGHAGVCETHSHHYYNSPILSLSLSLSRTLSNEQTNEQTRAGKQPKLVG
jgi:hypothetical protein